MTAERECETKGAAKEVNLKEVHGPPTITSELLVQNDQHAHTCRTVLTEDISSCRSQ
jgi:hypothetical protein